MVNGRVKPGFLYSQAGCGVSLRVEVDKQCRTIRQGEAGGQIDRGRGFPDAALLINNRDCSSDAQSPPRLKLFLSARHNTTRSAADAFHVEHGRVRGLFHVEHSAIRVCIRRISSFHRA